MNSILRITDPIPSDDVLIDMKILLMNQLQEPT